jgi:cell division protein FtsZ
MEFDLPRDINSIIKVIGVGGGGSNAVNHMYNLGIKGVDFIVCNTDRQALDISPVPYKIQLGLSLTEGRGAGAIPEIGKNAAIENIEDIREFLGNGTKMVFVTAGMGGGTGTGAAPVIAQVAKEMGILTVGIVTVPFSFEGRKRRQQAEEGLEGMRKNVDTLLVINNERLRQITGNLTIGNAFSQADNVLSTAAKGIAEVISVTGAVNVDFNDVNTVMKDSGVAIMGSASAEGENRAIECVQNALNSPLLNDNNIQGANYVLLNITYGDKEVLMDEIGMITDYIQQEAGSTADVIWGHGYDPTLGDKLSVTIIATGFKSSPITGFEKAPERTVINLDQEPKNEITAPLQSPTQVVAKPAEIVNPVIESTIVEEPYLKVEEVTFEKVEPTIEFTQPVAQVQETPKNEFVREEPVLELDWDITPTASTPVATQPIAVETEKVAPKPEIIKHILEDQIEAKLDLSSATTTKTITTAEQQRLAQERLERIQLYTSKLRKADGINALENEPAYVRRNINLDHSSPSTESTTSRFGIADDVNGTATLRSNNSFLHDNVD